MTSAKMPKPTRLTTSTTKKLNPKLFNFLKSKEEDSPHLFMVKYLNSSLAQLAAEL